MCVRLGLGTLLNAEFTEAGEPFFWGEYILEGAAIPNPTANLVSNKPQTCHAI